MNRLHAPRAPLRIRLALLAALCLAVPLGCDSGEVTLPGTEQPAGPGVSPESALPPGHPPIPPAGEAMTVHLAAPESWIREEPANNMRVAQWRIGAQGEDPGVECAQFRFSGGGTVDDNMGRWMNQMETADGGPVLMQAQRATVPVSATIRAHTLYVPGTYVIDGMMSGSTTVRHPGWAMYGVVFEFGENLEYLKCVGAQEAVDAAIPSIRSVWESAELR